MATKEFRDMRNKGGALHQFHYTAPKDTTANSGSILHHNGAQEFDALAPSTPSLDQKTHIGKLFTIPATIPKLTTKTNPIIPSVQPNSPIVLFNASFMETVSSSPNPSAVGECR